MYIHTSDIIKVVTLYVAGTRYSTKVHFVNTLSIHRMSLYHNIWDANVYTNIKSNKSDGD